jgi:adenine phosphoribosyltransferase
MSAASELLKQVKADVISAACIIELDFLNARQKLDMPCYSLISYNE